MEDNEQEVKQEVGKVIEKPTDGSKKIQIPNHKPISKPDTIEVPVKLLMEVVNIIHKQHGQAIDAYNGLINSGINSGKIKMK